MKTTHLERREGGDEANPKIESVPSSNTEKEPDDWVSGHDPITGAQASYLKPCPRKLTTQKALRWT